MKPARTKPRLTQFPAQGAGPLYHRRYWVRFITPQDPYALMQHIKANLASYTPSLLADFEKAHGRPWEMRVGDEYDVTILGPWNGSVRVAEVSPLSFSLVTLKGHPEAGHIRFSLHPLDQADQANQASKALKFQIESWARSRDGLVQFTYAGLKVGMWLQRGTWTTFCRRVMEWSEGEMLGRVQVKTQVLPWKEP